MKHLPVVILLLAAVLVAGVAGCGGLHRYDGRLVAADSLMQASPDSALAIVSAIDSLRGEDDRAYRDLLLTQARYKTYQDITAGDDSAVTRAMAWYRAHSGEREKLTRAYLYKGAVMQELGHVDSAMYYYKTAEVTADPKDYFNLGYSKMRIACLYEKQHSQNEIAIVKLKDAIRCFEQINDTTFLISCFGSLGGICGVTYPDSTEYYLSKAIDLAQRFDPPRQYTFKSKLAGFYFYHYEDYSRAKDLAMDVLCNGSDDCLEYQFYYYATISYLKMGNLDSAKMVLERTPVPIDAVDSMNLFDAVAQVAKAEGNLEVYGENAVKSSDLTSEILADSKEKQLVESEKDFNKQQILKKGQISQRRSHTLAIALIVVSVLLGFAVLVMRQGLRSKEKERKRTEYELNAAISALNEKLEQIGTNNANISTLVKLRLDALQELFDSIRFRTKNEVGYNRKRRVVTLRNILSGLGDRYVMMDVEPDNSFWEKIRLSVDGEYNGIVSFVENQYPNLTARDLKIFCLLCANVSPQIIKLCMNLTNVKTVSNYRGQFMKKIGLNISFDEFVKKYLDGGLK